MKYNNIYSYFFTVLFILSYFITISIVPNIYAMESVPNKHRNISDEIGISISNEGKIIPMHDTKKLVVKVTQAGITVEAENTDIYELFSKIGISTGIPVHILDPDQKNKYFINISFENLPIQQAMDKILAELPAGGLATITKNNAQAPIEI